MSNDVFVTRTSSYLPLEPVDNEAMETLLGKIGGLPSKARRLVLRNNGIKHRHYVIDPVSGKATMNNAQVAAQAVRALGDLTGVDCLAAGTSRPDQIMPGHGVMVHGELGLPRLEVVSLSGICVSGAAAFKYAWMAVKAGQAERAVAVGSEVASTCMQASNFDAESEHKVQALGERPEIAFEKDFLRWMLSDGAGAVMLEKQPRGSLSLKVKWVEITSAANDYPVCMYSGAEKNDDGSLTGWQSFTTNEWTERSVFSVKQDVKLLNENVVRVTLTEHLSKLVKKYDLANQKIDWFLPHLSSKYFFEPIAQGVVEAGLDLPMERWFTNLTEKGNTGSASPYIMLDELFKSGRIQKGQQLLMFIPESGRFSSSFIMLEAV